MARIAFAEDRSGRDLVFTVDGQPYRAGAASARCFRDIQAQFSTREALDTVAVAVDLMTVARARWPDVRGPQLARGEREVLGEAMLLAGGVREDVVEALCAFGNYRNNASASFRLRDYGFRPPRPDAGALLVGPQTRYWRVGTSPTEHDEDWWAAMRDGNFVAIGWHRIGDLSTLIYQPDELERRIARLYPNRDPARGRRTMIRFVTGPRAGDLVVAASGVTNLGVGRICGDYTFSPEPLPRAPHHRPVEWLTLEPWRGPLRDDEGTYAEGYRTTFVELERDVTLSNIEQHAFRRAIPGVRYRRANENNETAEAEPFTQDPEVVDRARNGHSRTQNGLADLVERRGCEPLSGVGGLAFDLAWQVGSRAVVAEVKSLPATSEESQLRLGLGQVLRYRHGLMRNDIDVVAVLAVERAPSDAAWTDVCASAGVLLIWPEVQEQRLCGAALL